MPPIETSEDRRSERSSGREPQADDEDNVMPEATDDEADDGEAAEPPAKRTRVQLLEAYYAKLDTLFKTRQRKEVKLRDLNQEDLQCFLKATEREVNNNLETGAYEEAGPGDERDRPEGQT